MIDLLALTLAAALDGQNVSASACEQLASRSVATVTIGVAGMRRDAPLPSFRTGGTSGTGGAGGTGGRGRGAGAPGTPDPAGVGTPARASLPPYCRVVARLTPSADSQIEMELWLPADSNDWNGKFQMVGNGGWAGSISYAAMATALGDGYATASTDTGHTGGTGTFAIGHQEKLVDFAYRAVHDTAVEAKALITAYYGRAPRLSYFNGCSLGGRQALMEAWKFPADFDGIIAGAPANPTAHLHAWDLATSTPLLASPAGADGPAGSDGIVPQGKLTLLNRAVLAACDATDGVKDGVLRNPRTCHFDVSTLQCPGADADTCLTRPQIESVTRAYSALVSNGRTLFPGKEPGSEANWGAFLNGRVPGVPLQSFLIAHGDATWNPASFDRDLDIALVEEKVGSIVDVTSGDLRAFKAHGGKLLLYHGWNDVLISPRNTINLAANIEKAMGGRQDTWMRLFMAPGMDHCSGGVGPSQVNWMAALERWREAGQAPASVTAARVANNRIETTRPLCPYPQEAVYSGTGSTNDAGNFSCRIP